MISAVVFVAKFGTSGTGVFLSKERKKKETSDKSGVLECLAAAKVMNVNTMVPVSTSSASRSSYDPEFLLLTNCT